MRQPGNLTVIHVPLVRRLPSRGTEFRKQQICPGVVAPCRARLPERGEFSGMVTAPVHKGIINDAGIPFTGHTEFLAEQTGARQVVMMLAGGGMRVALATTHLP